MRWVPAQGMPFVQALWRHRWLAVGTVWLVCTAGWISVAFMPTNRPLLMTYALALGIGAGPVAPLLVMQLDRSFATLGQLRDLGIPILGSMSRLSIGAAQRRAALQLIGVTASALVLVAVYGTLLILNIGLHSVGV